MQLAALLPDGMDDIALSRRAAQVGVSIRPLSQCYRGAACRSGVILGYGGVDARAVDEAIRRLAHCL
jgi:GntR family transcriptional regulator/MocR family aminotransferase